jgi:hypothetical protein
LFVGRGSDLYLSVIVGRILNLTVVGSIPGWGSNHYKVIYKAK